MTQSRSPRRWQGPPLFLQMLGLLIGSLIIAQAVTLFLTVLLPPAPSPQHSLDAVAAALRGETPDERRADRLQRVVQSNAPDIAGRGWLISERSRSELARLLNRPAAAVRLAFYTPLPFVGPPPMMRLSGLAGDAELPSPFRTTRGIEPAGYLILAQATGPAFPTGGLPRGAGPPARDTLPPGVIRGGPLQPGTGPGGALPGQGTLPPTAANRPLINVAPGRNGAGGGATTWIPGDGGATIPPLLQGIAPRQDFTVQGANRGGRLPGGPPPASALGLGQSAPLTRIDPLPVITATPGTAPLVTAPPRLVPEAAAPARAAPVPTPPAAAQPVTPAPAAPVVEAVPAPTPALPDIRQGSEDVLADGALPIAPRAGGLFGIAPAPFVEGDFVAALQLPDGRWSVVQPAPEPFPNAWQRRVLLWFAISFAVVAPLCWLFARRLVKPLTGFAEAAEQLGRDPSAAAVDLDGPAEVGRAARAFSLMQSRLKSFVDDRTAMVGAISHDLRTPLTRLRFRLEEVDDEHVREGMVGEVEEMEAMITSVLNFIRDASTANARERLDLRTIVEDVVEDAAMVGGDVRIESAQPALVDIDVLGIRRVLGNLIDNALKYGDRARIRVGIEGGEAVADVIDAGPGLPEADLDRAFEPFYRAPEAQASNKRGSGLGLAVCRSLARSHGGDVRLLRTAEGFMAQLRIPLAFSSREALAA